MIKNEIDISFLKYKCKVLGFKYEIHPESIEVRSQFDDWFFTYNKNMEKRYSLYHMNKKRIIRRRTNYKESSYHSQRKFYDLEFMLKSIKEHDEYKLWKNDFRHSRMGQLFSIVEARG